MNIKMAHLVLAKINKANSDHVIVSMDFVLINHNLNMIGSLNIPAVACIVIVSRGSLSIVWNVIL